MRCPTRIRDRLPRSPYLGALLGYAIFMGILFIESVYRPFNEVVSYVLALFLSALALCIIYSMSAGDLGLRRVGWRPLLKSVGYGFLEFVLLFFTIGYLYYISPEAFKGTWTSNVILSKLTLTGVVITFIYYELIAISEEIFFRGAMLGLFSYNEEKPKLFSGVFAFNLIIFTVTQLLPFRTLIGLISGLMGGLIAGTITIYLRLKYKSILPTIAAQTTVSVLNVALQVISLASHAA